MTVADIKIQTLKLMGLNSEDISPAILPDLYADENYTDYLSQMPPAITRAMNRIKTAGVVPQKSFSEDALTENKRIAKYDLNALIPDFSKLRRVVVESETGYCGNYPYTFEGVNVVLFGLRDGQTVTFIYEPKMPVITTVTPDSTEIPLPDELKYFQPMALTLTLTRCLRQPIILAKDGHQQPYHLRVVLPAAFYPVDQFVESIYVVLFGPHRLFQVGYPFLQIGKGISQFGVVVLAAGEKRGQ